jgi:UDP-N-acetylmuramoylalanine--D-glutamate ligase
VPPVTIRDALRTFRLDPHRIELVAEAGDVRWVDDSKATNPHAADASLGSYPSVVWVVGGLLKGVDIGSLVEKRADRLRAAIVIGVDREPVLEAFARHAPGVPVHAVDESDTEQVMPVAARLAAAVARPGDVVLLAPAAASMDQFDDYTHRGRAFAEAVRDLLGGGQDDEDHPPSS